MRSFGLTTWDWHFRSGNAVSTPVYDIVPVEFIYAKVAFPEPGRDR